MAWKTKTAAAPTATATTTAAPAATPAKRATTAKAKSIKTTATPAAKKPAAGKKAAAAPPSPVSPVAPTASSAEIRITQYTAKSVAIHGGDIPPARAAELEKMGARLNPTLTIDGARTPGWILPASRAASAAKWVGAANGSSTAAKVGRRAELAVEDADEDEEEEEKEEGGKRPEFTLVAEYTEKSGALLGGDTRAFKEQLAKMGARFNARLKAPSGRGVVPGWVFPKARCEDFAAWARKKGDLVDC